MRVVFMGSPAFSVPSLRAVQRRFDLVGVVTQPDRPAGRGRRLQESEVKRAAADGSIPLLQPLRLKEPQVVGQLEAWRPDVIVVAAFGQLIPPAILDLPLHGCVNVHPSLLPRWRGASPIQAAILHGDDETGVTIMKLDAGLDTGPIIAQRRVALDPDITGGELAQQLAELGASLLIESLPDYVEGVKEPVPQDEARAMYAPAIASSSGGLDFTRPAAELSRQVRAYEPRPGSFLTWRGSRLIVRRARPTDANLGPPGRVDLVAGQPSIATAVGALVLEIVQPAGKGRMEASSFVHGAPDFVGSSLLLPNTA
jgi:methionyl-tRNA formyltransferase